MHPTISPLIKTYGLSDSPRAHFIGATGAGMKALAEILLDAQWTLTGSDAQPDPISKKHLESRGMVVALGHQSNFQHFRPEIVVYSAAISESNPERQHAQRQKIPQISYVDALATIFNPLDGIAVCGTHGKSSTTALIAHLLMQAGRAPSFACGAERIADRRNGRLGESSVMVAEACEYARHFLKLKPQTICLLGIEDDHFECYPTIDHARQTYAEFVSSLPTDGQLIVNADCPQAHQVANTSRTRISKFSIRNPQTEWFGERAGSAARVLHNGNVYLICQLKQPGRHSLLNLLAAIATTHRFALSKESLSEGVRSFQGLQRRFQVISEDAHRTVIDDYAHHPTELRATLMTAREQSPNSVIRCLFQPHQVLRTQCLLTEFASALCLADDVMITPIYAARETDDNMRRDLALQLADLVSKNGTSCRFLPSLDQLPARLETRQESHEVLLTIGAGDITRIHYDRT